ncbi:HvfC family RiPP maturation protein [Pseudomonas sp. Eth.TT006]
MADLTSSLHSQQLALTRYLRDPDRYPPPAGMNPARAQVYRDLVLNNLLGLLGGTFPVLVAVLGDAGWRALVRGFLRDHRAQTPLFGEIAREFVDFVASLEDAPGHEHPWYPFLPELAHYEWVEMALQQLDAAPLTASDAVQLLDRPLRLSPLVWPLAYTWPVHRLGPGHLPAQAPDQPTLLLISRVPGGQVQFSQVSPLAWRLLQRIEQFPDMDGRTQLHALAAEADAADVTRFVADALVLLRQLHEQAAVGVAK